MTPQKENLAIMFKGQSSGSNVKVHVYDGKGYEASTINISLSDFGVFQGTKVKGQSSNIFETMDYSKGLYVNMHYVDFAESVHLVYCSFLQCQYQLDYNYTALSVQRFACPYGHNSTQYLVCSSFFNVDPLPYKLEYNYAISSGSRFIFD